MDHKVIWFSEKRVVRAIRNVGLAFSLLLASICLLVHYEVIVVPGSYVWAAWPLVIDLILLGLLQRFWNPFTETKVDLFISIYICLAAAISVLLTGFSTLIFFGWLVLIMMIDMFLGRQRAILGYIIMLISLVARIYLQSENQTLTQVFILTSNAFAVGVVAAVASVILRMTGDSVKKAQASRDSENLEHSQLTTLINSMADGVIAVDKHAKVLLYNAAALNVLDINSSMQHKSIGNFMPLLTTTMQAINVVDVITTTKVSSTSRDYRLKYSDGSIVNLYLAITPVHLGYGKGGTQGFVLILRDITREKSLEEERDEFISVVSHELRTPIAISEGNISNAQFIAAHNPKPEDMKKALDEAHNQVLFLADMINDLATLSRSERGKLVLELEDIAVPAFAEELADNYRGDAEKKGLEFKLTVDPGLNILRNSQLYVREILQNFITNAIKYTEAGSVSLAVTPKPNGVLFAISDTGIGISKADQEKVFDKFFRSEDYRTRQHNGTGLGLYVTMKLARLVHAEITIESELNKGSTFTIFIPSISEVPVDAAPHASPAA